MNFMVYAIFVLLVILILLVIGAVVFCFMVLHQHHKYINGKYYSKEED